jgi:hypothetical protein
MWEPSRPVTGTALPFYLLAHPLFHTKLGRMFSQWTAQYSKPFSSAGSLNADSVVRVQINANNRFTNAENSRSSDIRKTAVRFGNTDTVLYEQRGWSTDSQLSCRHSKLSNVSGRVLLWGRAYCFPTSTLLRTIDLRSNYLCLREFVEPEEG